MELSIGTLWMPASANLHAGAQAHRQPYCYRRVAVAHGARHLLPWRYMDADGRLSASSPGRWPRGAGRAGRALRALVLALAGQAAIEAQARCCRQPHPGPEHAARLAKHSGPLVGARG